MRAFRLFWGKLGGGVTRHSGKAGPVVIPGLQFFFISDILFLMIPARTERKFCVARAAKEENVRMAGLKEHIFLIGFMGCGKSMNAARLAEMTGAEQVEMDQEIVNGEQMEIAEIFKEKGEPYFRSLETELIRSFSDRDPAVISCGGGAVLKEENVRLMKKCGKIVLLTATPETIYGRVKDSTERPVLNGNMNLSYIEDLMEKRRPKYEAAADITVATDGKTAEEICEEILDKCGK